MSRKRTLKTYIEYSENSSQILTEMLLETYLEHPEIFQQNENNITYEKQA